MDGISGKVTIITGASSGSGEATAKRLAAEGARVVLLARREDRLKKVTEEITSSGEKAAYYTADVTDGERLKEIAADVVQKYGRIDVLVNNAGLMALSPLSACRSDEWMKMVNINVKGVLFGIAAVLPVFEKQKSGHVVNISSVAGLKVSPNGAVYSATKFAVKALSEGLRMKYAGMIRVTTLYPGYIQSELMYRSGDAAVRDAVVKAYKSNAISSDSVANAILYALSQPDDTGINEITVRPTKQEF